MDTDLSGATAVVSFLVPRHLKLIKPKLGTQILKKYCVNHSNYRAVLLVIYKILKNKKHFN